MIHFKAPNTKLYRALLKECGETVSILICYLSAVKRTNVFCTGIQSH